MGALLLAASTAIVWASGNTAPRITSITGSASVINPGQTLTVNGSFSDPDVGDSHTVFIYWSGGDVSVKDKVQLPVGQTTFHVKHTYTEPLPPTQIKIVVTDHQRPFGSNDNTDGAGWDQAYLPIEVRLANVAPSFVDSSITVETVYPDENVLVVVDGAWIDPDPEPGSVTFSSGVGSPLRNVTPCDSSGRQFRCEREYAGPFPKRGSLYSVELQVTDGHGGSDTYRTPVRIP